VEVRVLSGALGKPREAGLFCVLGWAAHDERVSGRVAVGYRADLTGFILYLVVAPGYMYACCAPDALGPTPCDTPCAPRDSCASHPLGDQ